MDARRQFGNRGEDLAATYFMAQGYSILERNWSCRMGEIDVIAEKDGVLHFVEVKTRRTREFGYPEEAITPKKLQHLGRAVEMYLRMASSQSKDYRVDALAITLVEGKTPEFHFVSGIL